MSVNLRKAATRRSRASLVAIAKGLGFLVLTWMVLDSTFTRSGPAISVAAPLIGYLALLVYLVRRRGDRRQNASQRRQ
jgi:Flp pilus assembly protein TadB